MTHQIPDDIKARILDAVATLADLGHRPSVLTRVRDLIRLADVTDDTVMQSITSALREAGLAATTVHRPLDHCSASDLQFITLTQYGHIVRVLSHKAHTVTVEDAGTGERRTIPTAELRVRDGQLHGIDILGSFRSFLSSDATLPPVRGTDHRHDLHKDDSIPRLRDIWPYVKSILRSEKRDIWVIIGYSVLSSLLGLSVPLASQSIVNAVALGVFNQQLVVLCAVVLAAMVILAVLSIFERYVADMIQRRLFVHATFDITYRLPQFQHLAHKAMYAPELVNRFFDVMTIQKSLGKFLLEGVNAVLVLLTGLLLLGIYHPFFLLYNVLFLSFLPLLTLVLGRGAIPTAIKVSKKKYEAAAWMEDIARNHLGFKLTGAHDFAYSRIDAVATGYVEARHKHFLIFARQIFGSLLFKAAATVGILGVGGILVLDQQISLGQLVAAELVVIVIMGAIEKLINQFDLYYDLIAAVDKLSAISKQPLEEVGGQAVPQRPNGGSIEVANLSLSLGSTKVLNDVSFRCEPGQHVSIVGESGAGKSTLMHVLVGLYDGYQGTVRVNGVDVRHADLRTLRKRIGLVFPENQLITGTIFENIVLGRRISNDDLDWVLRLTRLQDDILALPDGIRTRVTAHGENIAYGMRRRILFARMIIHKPDILLIDEAFDGIEDNTKLEMLDELFNWPSWTIINISHDPEVVRRTDRAIVLRGGKVVQDGRTDIMCQNQGHPFRTLFPDPEPFLRIKPNSDEGGSRG